MGKKKEIIITILIVAIVLFLTLFEPIKELISSKNDSDEIVHSYKEYITVNINGEVLEEKSFTVPKGVTVAYIEKISKGYLNEYSYLDIDEKTQITKNTTITFNSKDFNNTYYVDNTDKVSINSGSYQDLITIYGIGDKRANKIISARKTKAIKSYEELKSIIGVSNEILERIKASTIL